MKYLLRPIDAPPAIDTSTGNIVLFYSHRIKWSLLIIGVQFPLTLLYMFARASGTPDFGTLIMISIIVLGPFFIAIKQLFEFNRCKIILTENSIIENRAIFKPRVIDWKKISKVSCSRNVIGIHSIDGQNIKVNRAMNGFSALPKTMIPKLYPMVAKKALDELNKSGFAPNHFKKEKIK